MDRLTSVLLAAGLGCFALAFLLSGVYPWAITDAKHPEASVDDLAVEVTSEFRQLKEQYPVEFAAYPRAAEALTERELAALAPDDPRRATSESAWRAAYAKALRDGRDSYVAEACWHCHSQFVRPVANEEQRFGAVRNARHYDTALDRPVLWGTRRVGPDLTNEGGLRPNDWHFAHLRDPTFDPRTTVILASGAEARAPSGVSPGSARIEAERPDLVRIAVRASDRCHLVLSDTDFPGWNAYVDDRAVPVLRANIAFRAVALEPGAHVVEFRYQPRSFWLGVLLAFAGIGLLTALTVLPRERSTQI